MIKPLITVFLLFLSIGLLGQTFRWAKKAGGTQGDMNRGGIVDDNDNVYAIGTFNGTISFDSAGQNKTLTSAGQEDLYIAKFNCAQNLVWVNRIGGTAKDGGAFVLPRVVYDNAGNIYASGSFSGTATFTTKSGTAQTLTSTGAEDIFLVKYDTSGSLKWLIRSGGSGWDEPLALTIDQAGDIILGGFFRSNTTFGTLSGSTVSLTSTSGSDVFVAKYTSTGVLKWVKAATGPGDDIAGSIATDKHNNIYVSGNFSCCGGGTTTFGTHSITNASSWGAYIAKADANGNWLWVNGLGAVAEEAGAACAVDDEGNVFFSGHFSGGNSSMSTSSGSPISLSQIGSYDIYLAKFNTLGVLGWVKVLGGTGADYNFGLTINGKGNPVITGGFSGTANFAGNNLVSSGGTDIYVCEFDKNGNYVWGTKAGGNGNELSLGVTANSKGSLYIWGDFNGIANFGTTTLSSSGLSDAFVAKIGYGSTSFNLLASPSDTICLNDSTIITATTTMSENTIFTWLKDGVVIPNEQDDSLVIKTAGVYQLIVANNCNEKDSSVALSVMITNISANAGNDTTIAKGDSAQLHASGGTTYLWSPTTGLSNPNIANPKASPDTTTKYVVKVTNGTCIGYDTVVVFVDTLNPIIDTAILMCLGDSVQLHASGGVNYRWHPHSDISDTTIASPYVKPVVSKWFFVTVTTGSSYVFTDSVFVDVIASLNIVAGNDTSICLRDTAQLTATGGTVFTWTPTAGLSNPNIANPKASPATTTTYVVKGEVGNCFDYDTVTVTVKPVPVALFTADPLMGDIPFDVTTTNLSTPLPLTYLWKHTADTTFSSTDFEPVITINEMGRHYILLEVTNAEGCKDTAISGAIDATDDIRVFIPNVFTPNSDKMNDLFEIVYSKNTISKISGTIWNRWGGKVYEFEMPKGKFWDGKTQNGAACSEGAYVYIIEAYDFQNKLVKRYKGFITLLR